MSKLALREGAESSSHVNIGSSGTLVSYVVQVSAFRQWQHAQSLKAALGEKGYAAFIGKIELPENKGTWYRVYIGRYFNQAGAKMAAARFYREENRQAMVIRQTG
ncbi:MAG: SPOR domain-containing protein [Nitrospinae bacterium]|nr:SPOR domain-containing protein [Nitrospinota bacterium]